jgi:FkbM family methyltransferase
METLILNSKLRQKEKSKNLSIKYKKNILFFFVYIFSFIILANLFYNKIKYKILNLEEIINIHENLLKNLKTKFYLNFSNEIISNDLIESQLKEQNFFCNNQKIIEKYEDKIASTEVNFNNKKYNMFVYKSSDRVSETIKLRKNWEGGYTIKIMNALNYFEKKKSLKKGEIYILDLGANIGWYSFYLGKYGYKIISFEPDPINYYILKKNFCINKDVNIVLINRGLYTEEKKCNYYLHKGNEGNGLIFCNKNAEIQRHILEYKEEVYLTKLSNFIPFLSDKNIAFIKIDVEGSEEKAINGGIELITKYHVPFIFMEWAPNNLRMQKANKKAFLLLFINNGYKFSISNFLDKKYIPIDEILKAQHLINLFIIYTKILE